jgi:hypothetical protein
LNDVRFVLESHALLAAVIDKKPVAAASNSGAAQLEAP